MDTTAQLEEIMNYVHAAANADREQDHAQAAALLQQVSELVEAAAARQHRKAEALAAYTG